MADNIMILVTKHNIKCRVTVKRTTKLAKTQSRVTVLVLPEAPQIAIQILLQLIVTARTDTAVALTQTSIMLCYAMN